MIYCADQKIEYEYTDTYERRKNTGCRPNGGNIFSDIVVFRTALFTKRNVSCHYRTCSEFKQGQIGKKRCHGLINAVVGFAEHSKNKCGHEKTDDGVKNCIDI